MAQPEKLMGSPGKALLWPATVHQPDIPANQCNRTETPCSCPVSSPLPHTAAPEGPWDLEGTGKFGRKM